MKRLALAILLLSTHTVTRACNSCGCSIANQSIGLLSQIPSNFVELQSQFRGFSTIHPDDGGMNMPGGSRELYKTFQISGRYTLSNRVQLMAFVPYVVNRRTQQGADNVNINGLGDITVLADAYVVKKANCTWKQDLLAGGGVKVPTGTYDKTSGRTEEGLPNMQPGTHSWDFVANANYTISYGNVGLNADAFYTVTTANKEDYKFGNRLSTGLSVFYKIKHNSLIILPLCGSNYDHNQKDYEVYTSKIREEESGGWQLYGMMGLQGYYKQLGLRARYQVPLAQHYNSGQVTAWYKADLGMFFMF